MKANHTILEHSYQNCEDLHFDGDDGSDTGGDGSDDGVGDAREGENAGITSKTDKNIKKHRQIDITSPDLQNKYIIEYITATASPKLTDDELTTIRQLNITQNLQIGEEFKNRITNHAGHYRIKRIEFSNLFSYGANNVIEFTNFKGVVGIIAPNHMGKSSILEIIIFTLFDTFSGKGNVKAVSYTHLTLPTNREV